MLDEYGFGTENAPTVEANKVVTAVLPHPLHGRLVERVILWVQPHLTYMGNRYKLTWWGDGIAYYLPGCG